MSNTIDAGSATTQAQSSALASSSKVRTFVVTYSLVGPLAYVLCLAMNWPLFTFHPATNRIALSWEAARSGEGPTMYWYGWTATSILAAAAIGVLATLLPESVAKRIPLFLVWLLPVLMIPYLIYDLRQWWFHP